MLAVSYDPAQIATLLIKAGADVNAYSQRLITALMVARDYEIIEMLLHSGADISASYVSGMTALMHQSSHGNLKGVNALLARGQIPIIKTIEVMRRSYMPDWVAIYTLSRL